MKISYAVKKHFMLFKWTGPFKKSEMLRNCDEVKIHRLVQIMTRFSYHSTVHLKNLQCNTDILLEKVGYFGLVGLPGRESMNNVTGT
jgi:hypothetical protein